MPTTTQSAEAHSAPRQQQPHPAGTVFSRAMRPVNTVMERFIPSSLLFSIVLTFIVAGLTLALTPTAPGDVLLGWGNGLSGLLEFMTQMALVLMLGHILANTRPMRALLARLGQIPRSAGQAYVFVFVIAALASLVTWGLGLVVGGLLAREVAAQARHRGVCLHFPLLVACGFAGFVVWHMGYSGSGPLTAATPGSFLAEPLGGRTLPITATTFSWWNLTATVVTVVSIAVALFLVAPRGQDRIIELTIDAREDSFLTDPPRETPADRLDASRVPTLLVGVTLIAYLALHFARGGTLTLDIVNWSFLALILVLVRNAHELIQLTSHAASNVGEILLQFPLYAGILGMMTTSGLIEVFSDALASIATPTTFGVLAFLSAGIVNFFVPSGGGQFAVQGPIMLSAGAELGVDPAVTIMAMSYGDQWTNMIQPFWAIPLLAIAGLKMREILGYTTVVLLVSGAVFAGTLLLVSL